MPKHLDLATDLRFRIERDLPAVRRAAGDVRRFLAARHVPERDLWACELAFVEVCNNAVQHRSGTSPIEAEVRVQSGEVEIRVCDDASSFQLPARFDLPPEESESGRGLFLIHKLMDQVRQERAENANYLVLRKSITGI